MTPGFRKSMPVKVLRRSTRSAPNLTVMQDDGWFTHDRDRRDSMAAILRWFEVDGRRHRAYFRQSTSGTRELVFAGPDVLTALESVQVSTLEDLSDGDLEDLLAQALMTRRQVIV
jgi:hypothetical protein